MKNKKLNIVYFVGFTAVARGHGGTLFDCLKNKFLLKLINKFLCMILLMFALFFLILPVFLNSIINEEILFYICLPVVSANKSKIKPSEVTGWADGESSFSIRIHQRSELKAGWAIKPKFAIELNSKDKPVLEEIQKFFKVGTINKNKKK